MRDPKAFFKETLRYVLTGCLSSFVNLSTYFVCSLVLSINYLLSNLIAWVLTVVVSYVADKHFVFRSRCRSAKELASEFFTFVNGRAFSFALDQIMMFALVGLAGFDSSIIKLVDSVAVVLINYVISRWIFKKRKPPKKETA